MPAFPALPAREDTRNSAPRLARPPIPLDAAGWYRPCAALHPALLPSLRIPTLDERFPAGRGGANAAAPFEFGVELGAEQEPGGPGHWSPLNRPECPAAHPPGRLPRPPDRGRQKPNRARVGAAHAEPAIQSGKF